MREPRNRVVQVRRFGGPDGLEVAEAHCHLEAGGLAGKLVLCPDLPSRRDGRRRSASRAPLPSRSRPRLERPVSAGSMPSLRKAEADLIVVGSHRPAMRDYLLGTNAARVVRHAHCSVLVARE